MELIQNDFVQFDSLVWIIYNNGITCHMWYQAPS